MFHGFRSLATLFRRRKIRFSDAFGEEESGPRPDALVLDRTARPKKTTRIKREAIAFHLVLIVSSPRRRTRGKEINLLLIRKTVPQSRSLLYREFRSGIGRTRGRPHLTFLGRRLTRSHRSRAFRRLHNPLNRSPLGRKPITWEATNNLQGQYRVHLLLRYRRGQPRCSESDLLHRDRPHQRSQTNQATEWLRGLRPLVACFLGSRPLSPPALGIRVWVQGILLIGHLVR